MAASNQKTLLVIAGSFMPAMSALGQLSQESLPLGAPTSTRAIGDVAGGPSSIITTVASLLAVIGLIILLGACYRWMSSKAGGLAGQVGAGGKAPSGILSILGRYPLGRGQTLVLLQVDRRVLVLCQSASGRMGRVVSTNTLSEIIDADEVASIIAKANGTTSSFGDVLQGYEAEDAGQARGDVEIVDLTKRKGNLLASLIGRRSA